MSHEFDTETYIGCECIQCTLDQDLLRVGDEVIVSNGPIVGGTITAFVTRLKIEKWGLQVGFANPDTSIGGAPSYMMRATGRRWNDQEKEAILNYLNRDVPENIKHFCYNPDCKICGTSIDGE